MWDDDDGLQVDGELSNGTGEVSAAPPYPMHRTWLWNFLIHACGIAMLSTGGSAEMIEEGS